MLVFIQGYEHPGPNNERKKIYASATTLDLYTARYEAKVSRFYDRLFDGPNGGKPLMHEYYANYFDLYWDLHLGVTGDAKAWRKPSTNRATVTTLPPCRVKKRSALSRRCGVSRT
jgi:hypothetical protein